MPTCGFDRLVGSVDLGAGYEELWADFEEEVDLEVLPLRVEESGNYRFVYTSPEYLEEAKRLFGLMLP